MKVNEIIRRAYLDGLDDRRENGGLRDDDYVNLAIFEAAEEYRYQCRMFGSLYDANVSLAECAKWGKIYRDRETSFILR